ncbi:BglG family transcription antiterminator [Enterococcus sp. CSURQ0835]|uniref:BglG family transcription antiterminator n=1 Tax=Enterococcus sp. CSURQ0835 TaxID=2681394 RepID=UPI00135CE91A|nr:PRD domain-containing protein [Enterococcus sp. CSURQ0835]
MKQKEKLLLLQLIEHKGAFLTSQELASELSLSDRTVRNYLKQLRELVQTNGGDILAKQGQGYRLEIQHKLVFDLFLNQLDLKPNNYERAQLQVSESADRQNYILNKLLLEEAVLFLDDLAEELFISRSSLSKDIQEIKEKLLPYALEVTSKPGKGFWVVGTERNKRHFIMDTFFGKNYSNPLKDYFGNSRFFQEVSFEELTIIILDETREASLKLSDIIIQNLVLHLSLAIKRLQEGFEIKDASMVSDPQSVEFAVAKKIVQRIEKDVQVYFPIEEIAYLALHLMAKSNQIKNEENQKLAVELTQTLQSLSQSIGYSLVENYQLKNGLLEHLVPMLVRLNRGIRLGNPLTTEIKRDYPEAYELTKRHLGEMAALQSFNISDDEWAYLTLHVLAALEKLEDTKKIQVLIICATGYGSAQLLKNRVVKEFNEHITIAAVKGYYEIDEESLQGIDLIISSIDLSAMLFQIPVIHVSVFLNDQDVNRIRHIMKQFNPTGRPIVTDVTQLTNEVKQKIFNEQLIQERFLVYDRPPLKEQILTDLITVLSEHENVNYKQEMLEQIKHRETMGQIIFSEQIVVPHPAVPIGVSTKIAVALIPQGMVWDGASEIKFVFMISPSYIENEGITVMTKGIVQLVDQLEIQTKILEIPTFKNFYQEFTKII